MTNTELAMRIVELTGGKENILRVENCMTRCRIDIADAHTVNRQALKETEGVLGIIEDADTIQVVLGPGTAKKITDEVKQLVKTHGTVTGDWEKNKNALKENQQKNFFKRSMKLIADIFIPLIPAIIGAGLFNGFASLIKTLQDKHILAVEGFWQASQLFFSLIGGAFLAYFVIYTGINAAKQFGATEGLGGMIGAVSIGADIKKLSVIMGLYNESIPLNSILTTGKGGVIGVIAGVWLLSVIEKKVRKSIPDVLDLIVTPFVSLLITGLIFVFAVMPCAGFLSDGLMWCLSFIINSTNPVVSVISGFVLAALFLPMVLFGLHHGLIPIYAVQLEAFGGVSLFPVLAMAGAGQVGAALAIYLKSKKLHNTRLQKIVTGALPAGFLGIGEPLIYGVTLPLFKPFITAGIGAGFGGAYVMLTRVMANAWGPSGLVAIAIMKPEHMLNYFFGLLVAYSAGFVVTRFMITDQEIRDA